MEELIKAGVDVNQLNDQGVPVLMYATEIRDMGNYTAGEGREKCMRLLIDAGANVNIQHDNGYTALMQTTSNGFGDITKMLTDAGADVNAIDDKGRTALMYAARCVFPSGEGETPFKCVQTLLGAGAHVNRRDKHGKNALKTYLKNGSNVTLIKLLLAAGEQHKGLPKDYENSEDSDNDYDDDYDDDDEDDKRRKEV